MACQDSSQVSYSKLCTIISVNSSSAVGVSHQITVNRLAKAGLNSFFPKSPPGFIVANILNPSRPYKVSSETSGTTKLLSLSKTEFRRSMTLSSAREISSINSGLPLFMAWTRGPDFQVKSWTWSCCCLLAGRRPPIKSEDSVFWWHCTVKSPPLEIISHNEVFPDPVYPTNNTGSSNLAALDNKHKLRRVELVSTKCVGKNSSISPIKVSETAKISSSSIFCRLKTFSIACLILSASL